jgi:hypothetical protein
MKYFWLGSVLMAGLIVSGGNAFAGSDSPPAAMAPVAENGRMLLADAAVDLDVTMEVVDEDAQSSAAITNVIELPVQIRDRYQKKQQEQAGSGPGPADAPTNGAMPGGSGPDSLGPGTTSKGGPTEAAGPGSSPITERPPQEPPRSDPPVTPTESGTKEKAQEVKTEQQQNPARGR